MELLNMSHRCRTTYQGLSVDWCNSLACYQDTYPRACSIWSPRKPDCMHNQQGTFRSGHVADSCKSRTVAAWLMKALQTHCWQFQGAHGCLEALALQRRPPHRVQEQAQSCAWRCRTRTLDRMCDKAVKSYGTGKRLRENHSCGMY